VNALMLEKVSVMDMAMDVGFDLLARRKSAP
jgi:hypothetical protein